MKVSEIKMVLNMSEGGGVVWYTKETTQIKNHVVSPTNIAVYTPQGMLSLPSYEKQNTSVLTGTVFSMITLI